MKKFIILLLLLSFSLTFISCKSSESKGDSGNPVKTSSDSVSNEKEPESEQPNITSSDIETSIKLIEPEIVEFLKNNGINDSLVIDEVKYMTISDYKESIYKNTLEDTNFDYFININFTVTVQKDTIKNLTLGSVERPIYLYDAIGEKEIVLFGRAFFVYKVNDNYITPISEGPTREVFKKIQKWKDYTIQK